MWSIALKSPSGTNSICFHETSHSWIKTDINEWINKIFNHRKWKGYICYNDDVASENGVVLWNKNVLGWLIHSCQNWPSLKELSDFHMNLPESVVKYGQSFAYIEMPIRLYTLVIHQLYIMNVNVYTSFPANIYTKTLVTTKVNYIEIDDYIIHIAKSNNSEMFYDSVYKQFGSGFIENWIKPIQNDCSHVERFGKKENDHSCYFFSNDEKAPWVYIGGFIFKCPDLWKAFRELLE